MVAYMPYKVHVHRIFTDLAHPWVVGYQQERVRARLLQVRGHRQQRTAKAHAEGLWPQLIRAPASGLALAPHVAGVHGRRAGRRNRRRCCATPSASPSRTSTRRRSTTCTRAPSRRTSSKGCTTFDHLARPVKVKPLTADGMPEVFSADFKVLDGEGQAGHLLRRRPGLQGQETRTGGCEDYVYSAQALRRPGRQQAPAGASIPDLEILGLNELREKAASRPASRPSTTTRPSRACARSTATRCSSGCTDPRPALRR